MTTIFFLTGPKRMDNKEWNKTTWTSKQVLTTFRASFYRTPKKLFFWRTYWLANCWWHRAEVEEEEAQEGIGEKIVSRCGCEIVCVCSERRVLIGWCKAVFPKGLMLAATHFLLQTNVRRWSSSFSPTAFFDLLFQPADLCVQMDEKNI